MANIEAVLCTPIGADPAVGVLYLQGSTGRGPFSNDDRDTAALFTRHLAPLADRLPVRERHDDDPTHVHRSTLRLERVIGRSPALAELFRQVALVAPLDVSVLLSGDSGTGKSQIARVIHDNGPRGRHPFVDLNCAALPDALIESELFGALPGAHSTATRKIDGKVAAAEGGTLFLDEAGNLSLPAQAKLLQLLQSKGYFRSARRHRGPREPLLRRSVSAPQSARARPLERHAARPRIRGMARQRATARACNRGRRDPRCR